MRTNTKALGRLKRPPEDCSNVVGGWFCNTKKPATDVFPCEAERIFPTEPAMLV